MSSSSLLLSPPDPIADLSPSFPLLAPANWKKGEPLIIHPSVSDEEAKSASFLLLSSRVTIVFFPVASALSPSDALLFRHNSSALFPGFTTSKTYLRFTTREQAAMLTSSGPG